MKTNILSLLSLTALLFAACATDDLDPGKQKPGSEIDTTGLTAFSMVKPNEGPETRLSGEYTGSGVDFYWSDDDNLFVNTHAEGPEREWLRDKWNNIYELARTNSGGPGRTPRATFWFEGEFTKPEYRVRYLGKNHGAYHDLDEIYIPEDYNYLGPHIYGVQRSRHGDFATGIAHRQPDGNYTFTLEHKGSYITFRPYSDHAPFTKWGGLYVRFIEVSADQALCGRFKIKGDTIDLSSRPVDDQYKKSTCYHNYNDLLRLTVGNPPAVPPVPGEGHKYDTPSYAIMSIAPGTYTNFTVRYWISTRAPGGYGYVTKTYPRVTFTAGKNKVISQNMQVHEYPADTYYMWDAAVGQHYWKGYEWNGPNPHQPTLSSADQTSDKYPKNNQDSRWYNEVPPYADPTGAAPAVAATRSCKDLPNINELCWYCKYGWGYGNDYEIYSVMNYLESHKMWFRKLSAIAKSEGKTVDELKAKAPDGIDYTRSIKEPNFGSGYMTTEKPDDLKDYFCLPMMGGYLQETHPYGEMFATGETLYYWSSTPVPGKPDYAYALRAGSYNNRLEVVALPRKYGLSVMWPTDR